MPYYAVKRYGNSDHRASARAAQRTRSTWTREVRSGRPRQYARCSTGVWAWRRQQRLRARWWAQRRPGGPGGGPAGGPGAAGFRSALSPLPSSPPAESARRASDVAVVHRGGSRDRAEALKRTQSVRRADRSGEDRGAGYPTTMPPPQLDDATVTYHGLGSTYALSVIPKLASASQTETLASTLVANPSPPPAPGANGQRGRGGAFRVFFGCLTLHSAQPEEIASRKLYAPASGALFYRTADYVHARRSASTFNCARRKPVKNSSASTHCRASRLPIRLKCAQPQPRVRQNCDRTQAKPLAS